MNANLIVDPVFSIVLPGGEQDILHLPELFETLGRGDVAAYAGAQRHQLDALHVFLSKLAANALDLRGATSPVQPASFWREALRELAGLEDDAAWSLVVSDQGAPAFMQPPTACIKDYKHKADTPDQFDVLQLAKNHDVKNSRMTRAGFEAWALALISIQTMGGNLGRGTHPVSCMNGGLGSRVVVGCYQDTSPSGRWQEDVRRLLDHRKVLLAPPWHYKPDGVRLCWLQPWDADQGLSLSDLHPLFIEICRRYRICHHKGSLAMYGRATNAPLIGGAKEAKGNVGDPWTPTRTRDNASLTPLDGFSVKTLRQLVIGGGDLEPAAMQVLIDDGKPAWFHASVLERGQGKTNGFHEVRIRIAPHAKSLLLSGQAGRERLGELSDWALTKAADVRNKSLRPALFSLLEGGPDGYPKMTGREAKQWTRHWTSGFDAQWSNHYFAWLWLAAETSDENAHADWLQRLKSQALSCLEEAKRAAPQRTGRRYRGRVRASSLFHNTFRKHFNKEFNHVTD